MQEAVTQLNALDLDISNLNDFSFISGLVEKLPREHQDQYDQHVVAAAEDRTLSYFDKFWKFLHGLHHCSEQAQLCSTCSKLLTGKMAEKESAVGTLDTGLPDARRSLLEWPL